MARVGFMWECICGNIVSGEKSPEECFKCRKLDNFSLVPEELLEEREKDLLEENIKNEINLIKPPKRKKKKKKK